MGRRTVLTATVGMLASIAEVQQTFDSYAKTPDKFAEEVLDVRLTRKQRQILRALVTGDWVTVRSGRRVGKSMVAACAALWFWATRPGARVVLTAPTSKLIREVVWHEIRGLYKRAEQRLGGDIGLLASTGLRSEDDRQVFGHSADTAEAFQGIAGRNLMFIADEASGVGEHIYAAILGNLAGGGKLFLIGNPTRASGFFFESHKSDKFAPFAVSSFESPNITGEMKVEGLATLEWIELMKKTWGSEESAMYRIHILGEFVEAKDGQMFPPSMLQASQDIWEDTKATGKLIVGVDPAGDGGDGDESAFVCRRGQKITWVDSRRGLSPDAHLVEVLGLIGSQRGDSWEMPHVVIDREGSVGAKVYGVFLGYLETHKDAFHIVGIRGSENARKRPLEIHHLRDELWFSLVESFKEGLAIPPNLKLQGDLASIRFDKLVSGKATVIRKNIIRKELGRSPDLGDALALAAYSGPAWVDDQRREESLPSGGRAGATLPGEDDFALDPYAGRRAFDPYAR